MVDVKNILNLAAANLRKNKGQATSLFIFVLIAVFLLNIGLVLFVKFGPFFDEKVEMLNAPHAIVIQNADITTSEQRAYIENYAGSTNVEVQNILSCLGEHYINDSKSTAILSFVNANDKQTMNPVKLVGESLSLDDGSIYVPYLMKVSCGYELGDTYKFVLDGKKVDFTIAGFTEEMMFGAMMNSLYRFYMSDSGYAKLQNDIPILKSTMQSVQFQNSDFAAKFEVDYTKEFFSNKEMDEASALFVQTLTIDNAKVARSIIPTIISIIIVVFSLILLVVSVIVIRFRIINSIEENIRNIGVLKATGYSSRQIVSSMVMQFSIIAVAGGVVGIILAQFLMPTIAKILESQSALVWNPGFVPDIAIIAFVFIVLVVATTSWLVAGRIKKLSPLVALRGEMNKSRVKKNSLPLEFAKGPLALILALKQLVNNKKQAVMISIIVALVTFTSVAGMSIYYNIGVNPDAFVGVIVGEAPDAGVLLKDSKDTEKLLAKLEKNPDVRKAFGYQDVSLLAEDVNVMTFIAEDFSRLEGKMLIDGQYPKLDNEVAIGANAAGVMSKNIGDKITVTRGGKDREYTITGRIQMMNSGGINMIMTYDGMLKIQKDYLFDQIYIYLNEGVDSGAFIKNIEKEEGDIFNSTINMKELIDAQFGSYGSIFGVLTAVILVVTILVIVLVLYMIIKTSILRRRRELGVQKALGFTNIQLMNQIALNYLPLIFIGAIVGGIAGYFGFNPIFVMLTRSAGIMKAELPSPMLWTVFACLGIVILSYIISLLISLRIRRISPYGLISE